MKIAVYTVARDEAARAADWLASCRDADVICVADAGSKDGAPDRLRAGGAAVHSIAVAPWRFDTARNAALALVPADTEVCVKLDLDERLQPGWRRQLEAAWAPGTTRLRYDYVWSWLAPGVPDVQFRSNVIHARAGYRWRHPTHEMLYAAGPERVAESDLAVHRVPGAREAADDLPLLELAAAEDRCPQTVFQLGRGYATHGRWEDAARVLQEYLAMPAATWKPERAHAMRLVATASRHLGRDDALPWLLRACAEEPAAREGWVDLAQWYHDAKDWAGGYHAATRALAVARRPADYPSFGYAWGERADDLAAVCAWYLGLKDRAGEHLRRALAAAPTDHRLRANAQFILA